MVADIGAAPGAQGPLNREGAGSSGDQVLVTPSGRPPPRISAPEPHHGRERGARGDPSRLSLAPPPTR